MITRRAMLMMAGAAVIAPPLPHARMIQQYMHVRFPGGYTILCDGLSTVIGGPVAELWAPLTEEARSRINKAYLA